MLKTARAACPPFITKDGSLIRELMSPRNSACKRAGLAEAVVPPGGKTECHRHLKTEEIYYFLQGSGKVLCGEALHTVVPGDCLLHAPGARHQVWNTGPEDLVFLCVCVPAYEHEDTEMLPDFG